MERTGQLWSCRIDIDQQLNAFHNRCLDPTLRKHVLRLVRDKELELRFQVVPTVVSPLSQNTSSDMTD